MGRSEIKCSQTLHLFTY